MRTTLSLGICSLALLTACAPIGDAPAVSEVIIDSPAANATVTSPLVVKGIARNNWFFEASLPVVLQDADGNVLAQAPGQAKTDWMQEGLIEFEATLNFSTSATSGKLIIRKDNPSGLPEHDGSVEIPVNF